MSLSVDASSHSGFPPRRVDSPAAGPSEPSLPSLVDPTETTDVGFGVGAERGPDACAAGRCLLMPECPRRQQPATSGSPSDVQAALLAACGLQALSRALSQRCRAEIEHSPRIRFKAGAFTTGSPLQALLVAGRSTERPWSEAEDVALAIESPGGLPVLLPALPVVVRSTGTSPRDRQGACRAPQRAHDHVRRTARLIRQPPADKTFGRRSWCLSVEPAVPTLRRSILQPKSTCAHQPRPR